MIQFLIAAPTSGCGKTIIARGLMDTLVRRGLKVQPFKCGPDYIDTKYHTAVCQGRPSVNLDTFMASDNHVRQLYADYGTDADVCIVEGMMGMFDGYDRARGSSAEIAGLLGLPVILIVDARSTAYSMAALITGYNTFDSRVHLAGVIFNKVSSESHAERLREACSDAGVECFGCIYNNEDLNVEHTYLGLSFSDTACWDIERQHALVRMISEKIDLDRLLCKCQSASVPSHSSPKEAEVIWQSHWTIAVARNEHSFSFIYQEHLDMLHRLGTVVFFDPETDQTLPSDIDLLYLPGGYPERHVEVLSENKEMLQSIAAYIEKGGRALAECGGMIYLSQGILESGKEYKLAGALPFMIDDDHRKMTLGYRQFEYNGQQLRGHEFHYTQMKYEPGVEPLSSVACVYNAKGQLVNTPVFRYKNLIASYTHLYWGEINLFKLFEV